MLARAPCRARNRDEPVPEPAPYEGCGVPAPHGATSNMRICMFFKTPMNRFKTPIGVLNPSPKTRGRPATPFSAPPPAAWRVPASEQRASCLFLDVAWKKQVPLRNLFYRVRVPVPSASLPAARLAGGCCG